MEMYPRIPTLVEMRLSLYRNASLWEEKGALARLVVGGPASGQVLISQTPDLVLAVPDALVEIMSLADAANGRPDVISVRRVHYSAAAVGIGDRIYRTWLMSGAAPEVHLAQALTALTDADPAQAETCRAA